MKVLFDISLKIAFRMHKSETPLRRTREYELEFYRSDTGIAMIDGEAYPHKVGNVLLIRPGQMRSTLRPMECYGIHFSCTDPAFEKRYLSSLATVSYLPEAEHYFSRLVSCPEEDYLEQAALMLEILSLLSRPKKPNDAHAGEIQRVLFYLQEHYAEPIRVGDLPALTYLSHTPFFEAFRRETGKSPSEYLCDLRLAHAKELLLDADRSIGEISEACGFHSQAYFHDVFRRHIGTSPSAWRREMWERMI